MITKLPTEQEIKESTNWDTWEKGPSKFSWHYDEHETCLLLEGEAIITDSSGSKRIIKEGDWVEFPKGMSCEWEIKKHLRKKYTFQR